MAESVAKRWAAIYANEDFICFRTYSGLTRCGSDPQGKVLFARPDDSSAVLGDALLEALSASRVLRSDEIAAFFDLTAVKSRYEGWVADLMQRFGYPSRRTLFKRMKYCSVEQTGSVITLRPTRHERLEGWSGNGIEKNEYVHLGDSSSPAEIGEGVRLALNRCAD